VFAEAATGLPGRRFRIEPDPAPSEAEDQKYEQAQKRVAQSLRGGSNS